MMIFFPETKLNPIVFNAPTVNVQQQPQSSITLSLHILYFWFLFLGQVRLEVTTSQRHLKYCLTIRAPVEPSLAYSVTCLSHPLELLQSIKRLRHSFLLSIESPRALMFIHRKKMKRTARRNNVKRTSIASTLTFW